MSVVSTGSNKLMIYTYFDHLLGICLPLDIGGSSPQLNDSGAEEDRESSDK